MYLTTLSGEIFVTLNIDPVRYYTYFELKTFFLTVIKSAKHYVIIQDDDQIFTDLYDIYSNKDKMYKLNKPNIIFYPYSKEDTKKIADKYVWTYKIIDTNLTRTLQTHFNLSDPDLHKDPIFMKFCISKNQTLLDYASDEIKDDIDIIYTGLNNGCNEKICRYMSDRLKSDREIIKKILSAIEFASDEIKDDDEIILLAITYSARNIYYASDRLKNDKTFMMKYLDNEKSLEKTVIYSSYLHIMMNVGNELINDVEFITSFLELERLRLRNIEYKYSNSFLYVGDNIKKNREIINIFLELEKINYDNYKIRNQYNCSCTYTYNCNIYICIDISLKYDNDIIKKCLELDSYTLRILPSDIDLDRETIILSLNNRNIGVILEEDENILPHIPKKYQDDKEIVIKTIQKNGKNYFYVSDKLKNDTDIIADAIKYCYHNKDEYTDRYVKDHLDHIKKIIDDIMSHSKYKSITSNDVPKKIMDAYNDKIRLNMNTKIIE
jgi:hypothetical protein